MTRMKAMTILNRIVEWTETDPRHVDLIIEELGLENANGSDVTGSKVDINETDTELDHEDAYRFRSIAARLNFLAVRQQRDMQANVEPTHVGLGQGSKAGEILAEAPKTGAVVRMAGCPVQPPGARRH